MRRGLLGADRMSAAAGTVWLMANFAVRLVHGPGWDAHRPIRAQDAWDQHAAFMDQLVDDGFVVAGGPVGGGEETLHLVQAADESEIRARLAADPWASAGLLEIGTIEAWALWLDSRRAGPGQG
jgi:uncharacterized protein YciI